MTQDEIEEILGLPHCEPISYVLDSVGNIHNYFRAFRRDSTGWWFRGQADIAWPLLPKAGRSEFALPDKRCLGRFRV
jgi:hypothetical protein